MDLELIEKLVKMVNNSGLGELKIETADMKIILTNKTAGGAGNVVVSGAPVASSGVHGVPDGALALAGATVVAPDSASAQADSQSEGDFLYITSPLVGVFKSLASADKPEVKVGDTVTAGQPVCVVEAMKLINEIESEHEGEVVEILVSEGDTVEYGQKLFKIRA